MDREKRKQILMFLPQNVLKLDLICLCGLYKFSNGHCYIVFLFAVPSTPNKLPSCLQKVLKSYSCENQCAGIVYTHSHLKGKLENLAIQTDINFLLQVDDKNCSYHLSRVEFYGRRWEQEQTKIVLYDSCELLSSLLTIEKNEMSDHFIGFLTLSSKIVLENNTLPGALFLPEKSSIAVLLLLKFIELLQNLCIISVNNKIRFAIEKCMKVTSVGSQLHRRYLHLNTIIRDLRQSKKMSLRCGNLISALIVDATLGVLLTILIWHYVDFNQLLNVVMAYTSHVVIELQKLIYWLMGVPAGLKLNKPLNNALGHFFLYHIYLWRTYMAIIKPVFIFVMESFTLIGVFGITFLLALFNDLISLATIHIYCFYGYAARLYSLQAIGLTALWRLFRGKKWNPLRHRVDSYSYDVHQLFIGTLMFTVLVFLLPTVLLYYLVFTVLRLSVLTVQGIIDKTVHILNILPMFVILLRFFGSSCVKGDIQFTVLTNQNSGPVILSMKAIHISYRSVIEMTMPNTVEKGQCLTWKHLASSLLWGRIIFPL